MKKILPIIIIALIPIIYGTLAFSNMPEQVVTHWDIHGVADSYGSSLMYIFLSVIPIFILLSKQLYFKFAKRIDNAKLLSRFIDILVVFFSLIAVLFISQAANNQLQILSVLVFLFGVLFIIIGSMLGKIHQNKNFGIRLPATLRSENVWDKTHYIGGHIFVGVGTITVISSVFSPEVSLTIMITTLLLAIIFITVYAERLYRTETGHSSFSK